MPFETTIFTARCTVIKNVEERKCMIHRLSQTFLHTPSLVPRNFGVCRATAKSGSRCYCKPPPWLLYIWAWCSVGIASNCLLFLRNDSPAPIDQHRQVEAMRHGAYSRGNGSPFLRAKKGISNLNKERGRQLTIFFWKSGICIWVYSTRRMRFAVGERALVRTCAA